MTNNKNKNHFPASSALNFKMYSESLHPKKKKKSAHKQTPPFLSDPNQLISRVSQLGNPKPSEPPQFHQLTVHT